MKNTPTRYERNLRFYRAMERRAILWLVLSVLLALVTYALTPMTPLLVVRFAFVGVLLFAAWRKTIARRDGSAGLLSGAALLLAALPPAQLADTQILLSVATTMSVAFTTFFALVFALSFRGPSRTQS